MEELNYVFIDGQNLFMSLKETGWKIDFKRFFIYLKEKYCAKKIYIFMGYLSENKKVYRFYKKLGYCLVFKEVLKTKEGMVKGNCDAELVLQAMIDYHEYDMAVIITGDGDFSCLVKYLKKNRKLKNILVPNLHKYSTLLKKAAGQQINAMNDLRKKLEYVKRTS